MKIVNLTPHCINYYIEDYIVKLPSKGIARISAETVDVKSINGYSLTRTVYGEVQDLPEPEEDTLFVVSAMVRIALPDRKDLVSPARLVRDEKGQIIGCESFDVN